MDGIKALTSMLITIMPVLIIMARTNRAVKNGFCIFYKNSSFNSHEKSRVYSIHIAQDFTMCTGVSKILAYSCQTQHFCSFHFPLRGTPVLTSLE